MPSQTASGQIKLKRAYEQPDPGDGRRILVDRLWPRGVKKADAAIDFWLRDIAPSAELRRWFGHRPERWPEFRRRYLAELQERPELIEEIRKAAEQSGYLRSGRPAWGLRRAKACHSGHTMGILYSSNK